MARNYGNPFLMFVDERGSLVRFVEDLWDVAVSGLECRMAGLEVNDGLERIWN
jgi:hypothetical protein